MSKIVRSAVAILIVLLIISVGVAVFSLLQKQSLEQQTQNLQSQLADYQNKETQLLAKAKKFAKDQQDLSDRLGQKDKEKQELQQTYDDIKSKYEEINGQLSHLTQERDDWKGRLETIRRERDDLMEKLKNRPPKIVEKIVYKEREPKPQEGNQQEGAAAAPAVTTPGGDDYWAKVLKEKAALQIDMQKAKADMDQAAVALGELRKQNADMQMELKNLTDAKQETERKMQEAQQEFERKLKYSEDLSNNLSLEVARSRDDQKSSELRAQEIKQQNIGLQDQVKQLTTTKLALEKTIAQINQDKALMQKKLDETQGVLQGRINEIWQIKQNLDQKIAQLPVGQSSNGEVELPPIVINANDQGKDGSAPAGSKSQGTIISMNEANNFVIVDLGGADGSRVGRPLTVYRGNSPVAKLEIIQVRKDISAADIKQSSVKLQVGDIVRY